MKENETQSVQLATFYIGKDLFGLEVMSVQEVTSQPAIVAVPLAPAFILGLVNLRGQISTALGLRTLLGHTEVSDQTRMSVVCRIESHLISIVVDSIGDVVEVQKSQFEPTPETLPVYARKLLKGIYKLDGILLSEIDLDKIATEFSQLNDLNAEPKRNGTRIAG